MCFLTFGVEVIHCILFCCPKAPSSMAALLEHCGTCMYRGTGKQYTKRNARENGVYISRRCIFQLQKDFGLLYVMLL